MPVIEGQRASILVPHDNRHINQKSMGGQPMRMRVAAVYPDSSSAGLGCVERLSHRTEIKKPVMDWLDGRQARLYCAGHKG